MNVLRNGAGPRPVFCVLIDLLVVCLVTTNGSFSNTFNVLGAGMLGLCCLFMINARSGEVHVPRNGQQRGRDAPADLTAGGPAAPRQMPSRDSAAANIGSLSGHQRGRQDHVEVVLFHQCHVDVATKAHVGAFTTSLRGIL